MRSCFSRMPLPVTVILGKTEANLRRCSSASLGIHVLPDLMIERRAERVLSLLVCSAIVAKLRYVIIRRKLVLTDNRFLGRLRHEDVVHAIMRSVNYASHVTMSIKGVSESVSVLNRS